MDEFYEVINLEMTASCTPIIFALHIFDSLLTNHPSLLFLHNYVMCCRYCDTYEFYEFITLFIYWIINILAYVCELEELITMKYKDQEFRFHDNLYKTLIQMLRIQTPDVDPIFPFTLPICIDVTLADPAQFNPPMPKRTINKQTELVKIDEMGELTTDLPPILYDQCLLDISSIQNLQQAGFDDVGIQYLQVEHLLYSLNNHIQEYGTSVFWASEAVTDRPVLSVFNQEACVHTGLTTLVHTALQNPCRILMQEYPKWMKPLLNVIPEAFTFEERHAYMYGME